METQINVDVMPRGTTSAYVNAPFDKAKETLESNGYRVVSLAENAQLRMQEGAESDVCKHGNYVREGVLYVPEKRIFLTKTSPIIANAQEATQCNRDGREFYLTPEQVEESLADSVELTSNPIPTKRFGDDKITNYAFGDSAKKYGEFLSQAGIKEMPVWLANVSDKPFARQMRFCRLGVDGRSDLDGYGGGLNGRGRVRGVSDSAEGSAKISEAYSSTQISKVLKELGLSGLEKSVLTGLKSQK